MLNVEACKALMEMGYPTDKRPQMCWVDYGPYGGWQLSYARDAIMPLGCPWVACPSEIEAMNWLEDEHPAPWRYERDDSGLWFATNGQRPTRKDYRELGRFRTPSELIIAIYQDWKKGSGGTRPP